MTPSPPPASSPIVEANGSQTVAPDAPRKSHPADARSRNRSLVLGLLFHDGPLSRAELARRSGLTRVTMSDLVGELVDSGLVIEQGMQSRSGRGKPGMLVDVDRSALHVIAIDLSRPQSYVGAVISLLGEEAVRHSVPWPEGDSASAEAAIVELAQRLQAAAPGRVLGLGVATPGIVSPSGVVETAPNVGWTGFNMQSALARAVPVPVHIANDANAAAVGEHLLAGSRGDLLLVKIGRGVGAGILVRGELVIGSHMAAGEIGHVTVGTDPGDAPTCACGRRGCLEAWVSIPAVRRRLADGDAGVVRDAGERLGIALAPIIGALNLEEIVVAGPEDLLGPDFRETLVSTLQERTLPTQRRTIDVRRATYGDDAVLRGAGAIVLTAELGIR
ncbi:ROK family transcriptional regulator [Labedella endophytica]|uniref:ROK family transcriptional regulator n=1 Tax=Labedella endophytica TaxID=1523160 RepID=A0A3S0VSA6_9MICO|nr:ROK family transcriptional regulator [Labedella endophytica]RUQ99149.1 ROK family transcriptional regulator [Labedella endophytica]